ncbi:MAG: hypothetical protein RR552_08120 [Oscillospiraceae bacterium]
MISLLSIGIEASSTLTPLTESKFVYYMSIENHLNALSVFEGNGNMSLMERKNNQSTPENLNLTNVKFKTRIFQTDATVNGEASEYANIYAYSKEMIDCLKLPLKKGNWFERETKNDGIIDAVSTADSQFKVGDIVDLTMGAKDGKKVNIKVRIIGNLKNPAYVPTASHIGQLMFSLSLLDDVTFNKLGIPALLINSGDIEGIEKIFLNTPKNEYIVFNDDISKEEYDANLKELSSKGLIATSEDINRVDNEWTTSTLKENLPMIIFLAILSFTGLICIAVINMTNYLKTFSIYFICGCTWKNCYKIIASYLSIIFLWTFSLTLLLALIFTKIQTPMFSLIEITPLSFIWFISVILLYLAISLIVPLFVLKRATPKEGLNQI